MKRNIQVSLQVSYVSKLSDDELKDAITAAITRAMQSVHNAQPLGLYLITIDEVKGGSCFPQPPSDEKLTSDIHIDRKREFEKELKQEEMWAAQARNERS